MYLENLNLLIRGQHLPFGFQLNFKNKSVLQLGSNGNSKETWNF